MECGCKCGFGAWQIQKVQSKGHNQSRHIRNVAKLTTHEVVDYGVDRAVEVAEPVGQLGDCHRDV